MTGKFMSLCLAALAGISAAPLSVPSVSAAAEPAGGISVTEPAGEHYYVDKIDSAGIVGQRSDVYNISLLTEDISQTGDTSRAVFGSNAGATESYIDYTLNDQDTVVAYLYETVLPGNARPEGIRLPKFSLLNTNWEVNASETEIEEGRYASPTRYTRIRLTYRLDEAVSGKTLRIHLYEQGESAALQLGRVEIYNSAETERKVRYAESGAFSVSGWITPQDVGIGEMSDTVDFENAMANMAASGINFSLPNIWEGDTLFYRQRLVYTCNKLGMQTLVYDADLIRYLAGASYDEATARQMVESYASEASFAGHFIMDEPNGEQLQRLKLAAERYRRLLPGKIFYVNLFPDYVRPDYEVYLDEYFDTVGGDRISYDYYVLQGHSTSEYNMKTTHLRNLDTAAKKAKEKGAALYTIIASTGHMNEWDGVYLRNIESKADLGFQAYSAMAYGIKGLTWFTYLSMDDGRYGEQPGMYDKYGNKTKVYDYVSELNADIRAFSDVYCSYDWTGTMLVEGTKDGENENFANVASPLRSHRAVTSITADHDVIAGTFFDGTSDALLLASYGDPSFGFMPDVTVTFDKPYLLTIYANGTKKEVRMNGREYTFHLGCGGGAFVELKPLAEQGENSAASTENETGWGNAETGGCSANSGMAPAGIVLLGTVSAMLKKNDR